MPSVPNEVLIVFVAAGVGVFLAIAILRMLFGIALPVMLVGFYALVFFLAFLVPEGFRAVAFDSGGVTTGPMTVPFIMALGVGISATRSDRHAADDSFGLVALCSIGPILAVMILSMIFKADSSAYTPPVIPEIGDSKELFLLFARELPAYMKEIAAVCGIDKVLTTHCARHTFACMAVEYGMPIDVLAKILGHSNTNMTRHYAKFSETVIGREMEMFGQKLTSAAAE